METPKYPKKNITQPRSKPGSPLGHRRGRVALQAGAGGAPGGGALSVDAAGDEVLG